MHLLSYIKIYKQRYVYEHKRTDLRLHTDLGSPTTFVIQHKVTFIDNALQMCRYDTINLQEAHFTILTTNVTAVNNQQRGASMLASSTD